MEARSQLRHMPTDVFFQYITPAVADCVRAPERKRSRDGSEFMALRDNSQKWQWPETRASCPFWNFRATAVRSFARAMPLQRLVEPIPRRQSP